MNVGGGDNTFIGEKTVTIPEHPPSNGGRPIQNVESKKCFDVWEERTQNGAAIRIGDCHSGSNQQWVAAGENLKVYDSQHCLDGADLSVGSPIMLWQCSGYNNQKFSVNIDGTIQSINNLCVENENNNSGASLKLATCNGSNKQKWTGLKRPITPVKPTQIDRCGIDNDTFTIPAVEGMRYFFGSQIREPGTYHVAEIPGVWACSILECNIGLVRG